LFIQSAKLVNVSWAKDWCTYTLITSFCKNNLAPTPRHGIKKKLFEDLMFNVDENVDESVIGQRTHNVKQA
jgi:hypothetical protein